MIARHFILKECPDTDRHYITKRTANLCVPKQKKVLEANGKIDEKYINNENKELLYVTSQKHENTKTRKRENTKTQKHEKKKTRKHEKKNTNTQKRSISLYKNLKMTPALQCLRSAGNAFRRPETCSIYPNFENRLTDAVRS